MTIHRACVNYMVNITSYTSILFRHHGRQTSQSFDDHVAAQRWKQILDTVGPDQALEILAAEDSMRQGPTATLTEWLGSYIDHLTGIGTRARRDYESYRDNDIAEFMGHLSLTAITDFIIARWAKHLLDRVNSAKTVANKHGFLSVALSTAADKPLIRANP